MKNNRARKGQCEPLHLAFPIFFRERDYIVWLEIAMLNERFHVRKLARQTVKGHLNSKAVKTVLHVTIQGP